MLLRAFSEIYSQILVITFFDFCARKKRLLLIAVVKQPLDILPMPKGREIPESLPGFPASPICASMYLITVFSEICPTDSQ